MVRNLVRSRFSPSRDQLILVLVAKHFSENKHYVGTMAVTEMSNDAVASNTDRFDSSAFAKNDFDKPLVDTGLNEFIEDEDFDFGDFTAAEIDTAATDAIDNRESLSTTNIGQMPRPEVNGGFVQSMWPDTPASDTGIDFGDFATADVAISDNADKLGEDLNLEANVGLFQEAYMDESPKIENATDFLKSKSQVEPEPHDDDDHQSGDFSAARTHTHRDENLTNGGSNGSHRKTTNEAQCIEALPDNDELKFLSLIRLRWVEAANLLPSVLIRRSTTESETGVDAVVDPTRVFDSNIGFVTPVSGERKQRIHRSLQLMSMLTKGGSHFSVVATWLLTFGIVLDTLSRGHLVLNKSLSFAADEKQEVQHLVESMIHALGEFVRVARNIVATIGDLLLLDVSTELTPGSWDSSWFHLSFLKTALEIEAIWSQLEADSAILGCMTKKVTQFPLDDLPTIRRRGAEVAATESTVCHFTLQPLKASVTNSSTLSPVQFDGFTYMAVAANFITNHLLAQENGLNR
jgi:hypothetical protein